MKRLRVFSIPASLLVLFGAVATADDPAESVPELKALAHYVGDWDVAPAGEDAPFVKGEASARWILDGRFVEQTSSVKNKEGVTINRMKSLMTYDTDRKRYRIWNFVSNGAVSENEGTWDERKKTMTSVRRDQDVTTTTTADFSKSGFEKWSIVATDAAGKTVFELSGTNTRRVK